MTVYLLDHVLEPLSLNSVFRNEILIPVYIRYTNIFQCLLDAIFALWLGDD